MGYGFKSGAGGGAGGGAAGAKLTVSALAGCTVTVSKDGKTKTKVADSSGVAVFKGLESGTWKLTTDNPEKTEQDVIITNDVDVKVSPSSSGISPGAGMNFSILGYATEEELICSSPVENTIGIITDTPITSYYFGLTEPGEPINGLVWLVTGNKGSIGFNAVKKNTIQVYPVRAKQYVDGAWVNVTAKSYQNGAWVDWIVYLYKDGELNAGRLIPVAKGWGDNGTSPTIAYNEKSISISMPSRSQGYCYFENKYDMTNFNTLKTTGTYAFNRVEHCGIAVLDSVGGLFGNSHVAVNLIATEDSSVDVSNITGEKYVGFFLSYYTSLNVLEIWFE